MKASGKRTQPSEVVIEITEDDYRREHRSGVTEEHALQPGKHVLRRGGFKARYPDVDVEKAPVKVRKPSAST